ncbi:MAG: FeoB-associated Cys-rich membrane protein [Clostridiales bacterium]|nr:FeoB-associated Cys-rich membrane protein [Clostridiales bacterium]MCI6937161.1 FeoB-associated Cys-rich membrane protein [Clostridiales bacterium]MDD5883186.1 FeoB-associated Cys-rich membrane protein [Bacillota bacterium]
MGDIIVLAVLVSAAGLAIVKLRKDKKKGGCCGNCGGCTGCCSRRQ